MKEEIIGKIVKRVANELLVLGNFLLNRTLRLHPELADSEEVRQLRTLLRELKELEKDL